jgi:nitrogen fixation protein FixH
VTQLGDVSPVSRGHGTFWMLVPVALLAASVLGVGSLAAVAARDPGFALEQNSYERAVRWDRQQADWAENARLGYHLTLTLMPRATGAELALRASDHAGVALHAASVTIEAFANARSAARRRLTLVEAPDGSYRAELADARPGLWELRCVVSHGGERYSEVFRVDVPRSRAP